MNIETLRKLIARVSGAPVVPYLPIGKWNKEALEKIARGPLPPAVHRHGKDEHSIIATASVLLRVINQGRVPNVLIRKPDGDEYIDTVEKARAWLKENDQ